ncbi:MAG: outer membrane beta-barrel protein [Deltaproteobacteria bacterium]|nr:outer membrane beta-barrel protein [Deltaproteobacteria bacterium]MBI4797053.1 outer membrane beta-barrel protein [Deltaproteobacteria bacterium]
MGTRAWTALALLWVVLGPQFALAADWSVVPSIQAKTEFNSNLNYSFAQPVSDVIFTLSPGAEFNYTTETSQLQGKLGLTGLHYLSNGQIDHIDQNYQINGQYKISPRWGLSLKSAYIVDSTLQEELAASGLIMNRTPRESIMVGPGITYNLTERLAATVNYNFNKVSYDDPRFRNYATQQAGLRLDYPLKNEKTLLQGNVLVRETRYPGSDRVQTLRIYGGGQHKFSENWEANLVGGINITAMDFQTQVLDTSQFPFFITVRQARLKKTEVNPYFDISTTRRWTNLSATAGYRRDESPSAYASLSEVNRVYGAVNYYFTEKLSGSLNAEYYISSQISDQNNFRNDYFSVSPQLNYKMTEKLALSPGYRFGLRDDLTNHRSATVQAVWLMLTYSYPFHYQR